MILIIGVLLLVLFLWLLPTIIVVVGLLFSSMLELFRLRKRPPVRFTEGYRAARPSLKERMDEDIVRMKAERAAKKQARKERRK